MRAVKKLPAFGVMGIKNADQIKHLLHSPLYTNAVFLMACSVSSAIFGFVFWMLVARIYSAADVGLASAMIAASSLLVMISGLGLQYGLIRFINNSTNPVKFINTSFTISGSVALVAGTVFVLGAEWWSPALIFVRDNPIFAAFFILAMPVFALTSLTDLTFVAKRRAGYALARNTIFNLLRLVLPFIMVYFFHSFGIFGSWGLALMAGLITSLFFFLPKVQQGYRPAFNLDIYSVAKTVRYSFLNYLTDFGGTAPAYVLPMLIVNRLSPEDNAFFYIAWSINSIVCMVPHTITTSFFAEGSYDQSAIGQQLRRSLLLSFSLIIPALILVFFLSDKLLLLFGNLYSENGTSLLRVLVFSAIPMTFNGLYFSIKRVQQNIRPLIFINAFAAVLAIGMTYFLLPVYGIVGSGIAWLASRCCISLFILVWWFKDRYFRNQTMFE